MDVGEGKPGVLEAGNLLRPNLETLVAVRQGSS